MNPSSSVSFQQHLPGRRQMAFLLLGTAIAQLPAQCDTPEKQNGAGCQAACDCICNATGTLGETCQQVCDLPGGVQSLPWCGTVCTEDDDDGFVDMMNRTDRWEEGITACVDAPSCAADIASFCCEHCKNGDVTLEVPWADDTDPVQADDANPNPNPTPTPNPSRTKRRSSTRR